MTTIRYLIIDKPDEVYLKIEADADIRRELSEYFCFEVPGYKFIPAYRNRVWDGKIRLFSYATGQIYAGLYPYILKWCEDNNVQVVDGTKIKQTKVDNKKVDDLIKALKIPNIEVRDYQREAFIHSIRTDRCLLLSPTASGKSLIIYLMLIFNLLRLKDTKQNKILIIVPTTSLVEQLFKDFIDYGYNSERNVHRIYQGHEKETNKRVIITTWQSIYNLPKVWFKDFGMVIGDEAHLFKAVSLTKIMTKLDKCKYRIGLTGTLDGTQCFTSDMRVTTSTGPKNIDKVVSGDMVLSYNENNKTVQYKRVLDVYNNGRPKKGKLLLIKTNNRTIKCTPEHKLYTTNRGWVEARELTLLDNLLIN